MNPLTNRIYVANRGSITVSVINGATNSGVATPGVGSAPFAVYVNPTTNLFYVANAGSNAVSKILRATNGVTSLSAGTQPYAIAVDATSNRIYVANVGSGSVTIINGATDARTTVSTGSQPIGIAVNCATNRAYVCNLGAGTVSVLDGAAGVVAQTLTIGPSPLCAVVDAWSGRAWVGLNVGTGTGLVEISATTDLVGTANADAPVQSIAINRATHKAYVGSALTNQVVELGLVTQAATPISVRSDPRAILVDEARNKAFVANFASGSVSSFS